MIFEEKSVGRSGGRREKPDEENPAGETAPEAAEVSVPDLPDLDSLLETADQAVNLEEDVEEYLILRKSIEDKVEGGHPSALDAFDAETEEKTGIDYENYTDLVKQEIIDAELVEKLGQLAEKIVIFEEKEAQG